MDGSAQNESATVPLELLEAKITELATHIHSAEHRWLLLIAEFDRRRGWAEGAFVSCAHWLNFHCGLDLGAARERIRVAHALVTLPQISKAMAAGQLSYSKVRALTRIASPSTEAELLEIGRSGTAQHVERLVRQYRRAEQELALSQEACQQISREVHWYFDEDGSVVLKARLPAIAGAVMIKALEAARDQLHRSDVSAEASGSEPGALPSLAMRSADALALIAESYLSGGSSDSKSADRYQVVLHVDSQTLSDDDDGCCEIENGPAIAAETARRVACDSSRVVIRENERGEPLDIGRRTRTVPSAIRRALARRDRGCRFPGCENHRFLDAHHVHHWGRGGGTSLPNLVMLCRFHHRAVHEGGYFIRSTAEGSLEFYRPDGQVVPSRPPEPAMA
ncbi:MAG: DUF222 domain-containing protein [Steroidobacteraceae bacterium]